MNTYVGTDLNKSQKKRVGDINCICETSNPNYILAGVDNFAIYLLKVGKDS